MEAALVGVVGIPKRPGGSIESKLCCWAGVIDIGFMAAKAAKDAAEEAAAAAAAVAAALGVVGGGATGLLVGGVALGGLLW